MAKQSKSTTSGKKSATKRSPPRKPATKGRGRATTAAEEAGISTRPATRAAAEPEVTPASPPARGSKPERARAATKTPSPTGASAPKATTARPSRDRLATYRRKRDFSITLEPSGERRPPDADGRRFVVQRHRASHLHYDLRLEAAGVLLSWAVPKGPTLDPDVRRMAIHVEDHPLDYFDFEGVIPAGEYGGGDVIVWDWGTWELAEADDPIAAVAAGSLHFDLRGAKLRGRFALVRRGRPGSREQWLLIHKHDEHAVAGWEAEDHPVSVKSGRTNDEVRSAPAANWSARASWTAPTPDELDALDALGRSGRWTLGDHTLALTNLDKVLFPADDRHPALTKRDLIRHGASMAPTMLPYLHDRPVNLHRFPDGIARPGFWHKARPEHAPDFVGRWRNPHAGPGETEVYCVLDNPAALAWAANFGALEIHPWTSTAEDPERPTWALIDIDPGTAAGFDEVVTLARLHRTAVEHLGIDAGPKVTGSRGIQIWIPVAARYTFDDTRRWVETLSRMIGATVPDMVSWEWETSKRGGLTRLDYTQNAVNKTLVAPFSPRARPGAPVSVPISWDELDDPDLTADRWTIIDVAERIATVGDPLAPLIGRQQSLPSI